LRRRKEFKLEEVREIWRSLLLRVGEGLNSSKKAQVYTKYITLAPPRAPL
tara:strand:- start:690 stop:839 length:150 start_codon:yes stop_codon:yes gene_type:complete